jgi:hypothetical protein
MFDTHMFDKPTHEQFHESWKSDSTTPYVKCTDKEQRQLSGELVQGIRDHAGCQLT